jgi:hypothetical protein
VQYEIRVSVGQFNRVGAALVLLIRLLTTGPVWADMLYFQDGHSVKGKVNRVTGDLIELKSPNARGFSRLWEHAPQMVRRNELMNRQDKLETLDKKTYTGEVIYMDSHSLELRTSMGKINVPRYRIKQLVLGEPTPEQAAQQMPTATRTGMTGEHVPASTPAAPEPGVVPVYDQNSHQKPIDGTFMPTSGSTSSGAQPEQPATMVPKP